jgi:hypothetical protein
MESGESVLQHRNETIKKPIPHEIALPLSRGSEPLGAVARTVLVVFGVFILAGFGLALTLQADPSGRGTHQQFGLPPCAVLTQTQIPCPTCGMTTSFTHFVRGRWRQAAEANTSGFLLALFALAFLPWSAICLFHRQWWFVRNPELWLTGFSLGWLTVVILEWSLRHLIV